VRIISLLPSATEIICQLGLADRLVGVTHECDSPECVRQLPKVTRSFIPLDASSREIDGMVRERVAGERALYSLDVAAVASLRPDLIVTQALCAVCAVAEGEVSDAVCALPQRPQVVNLEPTNLAEVLDCLRLVAVAAGCEQRAEEEIAKLNRRVAEVVARSATVEKLPRVVILEWIDPTFSSGHWTPELVRLAGGCEMVGGEGVRSRTLDWNEIVQARPEVLVIACCGFDVERTLEELPILRGFLGWDELPCVASGRVYVVDGSAYFSRPGPRLVDSLEILAHLLHPEVHSLPKGLPAARMLSAGETRGEATL
jgi:iron complex transport system substrate-binding protein